MLSFMNPAVDKVIKKGLVYRELIAGVGGFQNSLIKSVREVEGRKSPDFPCVIDLVNGSFLFESENFHTVFIVVES